MKLQLDLYGQDTFIKAHLVSINLELNNLDSEEHELAYRYDRTTDKRKPQKRITEFLTRHVYSEYEIDPPVQRSGKILTYREDAYHASRLEDVYIPFHLYMQNTDKAHNMMADFDPVYHHRKPRKMASRAHARCLLKALGYDVRD